MIIANGIGYGVLLWCTLVGTLFMVAYSFRGNWWNPPDTDPHGEHRSHLGYFTLNLTLTFWVYDLRPLIDQNVFAWVRAVLFAWVGVNMTWRLWLLVRKRQQRATDVPST